MDGQVQNQPIQLGNEIHEGKGNHVPDVFEMCAEKTKDCKVNRWTTGDTKNATNGKTTWTAKAREMR